MATTARGIRYPIASDTPAVHTDLKNLADDSTSQLDWEAILDIMKAR